MDMITISKTKLQELLDNFYEVCCLCDECDIYEHEGLDESMQEMKDWVEYTFGRDIDKEKYE
jgi:hypothetical protein